MTAAVIGCPVRVVGHGRLGLALEALSVDRQQQARLDPLRS